MNRFTKILIAGLLVAAGATYAADATDPTVKAWQEMMDNNGMNAKILGDMAGAKVAYDAVAAEAAKAALIANGAAIATLFAIQAADPASKANPAIWTTWDDFVVKAQALTDAATALDASTLEGVQAGMGAVGGACGTCHKAYKM